MKDTLKPAIRAHLLGLTALLLALIFGVLIAFIVSAIVLLGINWGSEGTVGEGFLILPLILVGLGVGAGLGFSAWDYLWKCRSDESRYDAYRYLARPLLICSAIVASGCAESAILPSSLPWLCRHLLVVGIWVCTYFLSKTLRIRRKETAPQSLVSGS